MATLVVQPDSSTGQDTYIRNNQPNFNYGMSNPLAAGDGGPLQNDGYAKMLIKFDISALPPSAEIISAVITLNCNFAQSTNPLSIACHRSLVEWFAGVRQGAEPNVGEDGSTWNHRNANGSVAWSGGAGGAAGSDYVNTASDTEIVLGTGNYEWDVTNDAIGFHEGAFPNHGWWFIAETTNNHQKTFNSSSWITASARPKITITYTRHDMSGSSVSAATVSGSILATGPLQGETKGEAFVTGTIITNEYLNGNSQGQATAQATSTAIGHLTGQGEGTATVNGIIRGDIEIAGSASGQTIHIADIKGVFQLTVTVAGTSTTSATPDFQGLMRGATTGIAITSAIGYAKATGKATVIGCNPVPLLYITDGTVKPNGQLNILNLLSEKYGYKLRAYRPSVAQYKEGGRFSSSPLSQGRRLTFRTFDNAVDVFELTATGHDQDYLIEFQQELIAFQEAAADYWISNWTANPIYLVARAARETNTRYAIIHAMSIAELPNPYTQPFFNHGQVSFDTLTLRVERGHWLSTPPGEFECVEISSIRSWTVSGWESGS